MQNPLRLGGDKPRRRLDRCFLRRSRLARHSSLPVHRLSKCFAAVCRPVYGVFARSLLTDKINYFTRMKLREDGFYRRILPPTSVSL